MSHVFSITEGGDDENHDRQGLGAIGSGGPVATHSLLFHDYSRAWSLPVTAYHLCAAKFMAERAALGRATYVSVLRWDGTVMTTDVEPIRALWEREGRPQVPERLERKLPEFWSLDDKSSSLTSAM